MAELLNLFVHIPHQTVVFFLEGNICVQVFGYRPPHTEHVFRPIVLFNVGNYPNFFLKIVQRQQLFLQQINIIGKFLNLHALVLNFLKLTGDINLTVLQV